MRVTLLRRRLGEGRYDVRFVGVGVAADYDAKRKPLLWNFECDAGVLEIISGTRATEGSVCGQLFWLLTGVDEPGQDGDTDIALNRVFRAEIMFDNENRRTVRLIDGDSKREITISNNGEQ